MAKSKRKRSAGAGHLARSRHNRRNPFTHRRRHRRNPFPENTTNSAKLVFSAALALLSSVYIPGWLLSMFGVADAGLVSYFLAAVVAFGPAYALSTYPMFSRGWLAGGGAAFIWRIIDDLTGNKYLSIQAGGMGSFILPNQQVVLPGNNVFGPYARGQKLLGTGGGSTAGPAAVSAPVGKGMGWVKYPYAA